MHGDRVGEDDESILSRTLEDLGGLLGIDGRPEIARVERWRPAIPQYVIGHGDLKAAAASSERDSPGLFLSGNTLLGISVADCVVHAHAVAARADAFLSEHFS